MRVVVDTNIFLVSISRRSPYHWIFEGLTQGKYTLCRNNEILLEYEEIVSIHMGNEVAVLIKNFLAESNHVSNSEVFFRWHLLNDQDDDKFSDCYLASGADYLVTHDIGFQKLSKLDFPLFNIVSADNFRKILDAKA